MADLREYYRRKMVAMGVTDPTEEDKKRMEEESAGAPPDPNRAFMEAEAQKSLAMAKKYGSDTILNMEKTNQVKVDTLKTLAEIDPAAAAEEYQALQQMSAQPPQQMPPEMMQGMPPEGMPPEIAPVAQ